ncbi:Eco57I restriction-modification methylase domain-containing protein [Limosilactobacillus mucosae]|jgi:DNA (cytosine-5)-methyltransferase 1|uniref:Eco57I restriction-modification methylase domain-containing protein n=1 Tax=Limosilactobacillus mucosae TaxID=97478 RepID=UPI003CFCF103
MQLAKIKRVIEENNLFNVENLLSFLNNNWGELPKEVLKEIAEFANANRQTNSAYYTDDFIVNKIIDGLPEVNRDTIYVLEPSAGIGNFVYPFILKFAKKYNHIYLTLNDIDPDSLKIAKFFLSKEKIPDNITISYSSYDFLDGLAFYDKKYDYVIGNPPFKRISNKQAAILGDEYTLNLAGQFLLKAADISSVTALVMPKNFLSTGEFEHTRKVIKNIPINKIIDFGEKGFKGVLIETIGIIFGYKNNGETEIESLVDDTDRKVRQSYITSDIYPSWLLYRNSFFDEISASMEFNVFNVFRDRQLTNNKMQDSGEVRVIKSRNIAQDGSGIIDIRGYDKYISYETLNTLVVKKYLTNHDIYLVPNMTYYPRMIRKKNNYVMNGSVAILELKDGKTINNKEMSFFATDIFRKFYGIARNKGSRSLNIDKRSVFWFGIYKGNK